MIVVDWIKDNATVIQALASVISLIVLAVLAKITWDYVRETKSIAEATKQQADAGARIADETERTREYTYRPEMTIWAVPQVAKPDLVLIELTNVGSGPARDIVVKCWWRGQYYRHDAPAPLSPREHRGFSISSAEAPSDEDWLPEARGGNDLLMKITWSDLDGKQVGPRDETVTFEQMQRQQTRIDPALRIRIL